MFFEKGNNDQTVHIVMQLAFSTIYLKHLFMTLNIPPSLPGVFIFYCMVVYYNYYLLKIAIIIICDEHLGSIFVPIHGNCL